ncbi:MAG: hypothetical protein ACHQK9_15520 [Reyranellales bacterium]
MTNREAALRRIAVGDIFHASAPNGASFICLALKVREDTIFARRITSQSVHEFSRATGVEDPDGVPLTIDSAAPLPPDIREIMLGLDRKYREDEYRRAEDPNWEMPANDARLTKDEIRGLRFVGDFYRDNPI